MSQDDAAGGELEARAKYDSELAAFVAELNRFHIAVGAPSRREMARRGTRLSPSNLSEIFNGKRLPKREVILDLVDVLNEFAETENADEARAAEAKRRRAYWDRRWREVRALYQNADSLARQARASATRTAKEIIAEAERQAEAIRSEALAQAEAEIAKRNGSAHRVLALAQQTADEAVAEARLEGNKILGEAHARAEQITAQADEHLARAQEQVKIFYLSQRRPMTATVNDFAREGMILFVRSPRAVLHGYPLEAFLPYDKALAPHEKGATLFVVITDLPSESLSMLTAQEVPPPPARPIRPSRR